MTRLCAVLGVLLVPGFAWGQDAAKQCVEGNPDHCVQPLGEGEAAPFSGQLYTPELALDHAEKVHSFDTRLKLEIDHVEGRLHLTIEGLQRLRDIDAMAMAQRDAANQRALEAVTPAFFEKPWFIATLTAVLTSAAFLAVFALAAEYTQLWAPAQ